MDTNNDTKKKEQSEEIPEGPRSKDEKEKNLRKELLLNLVQKTSNFFVGKRGSDIEDIEMKEGFSNLNF